MNDPEKTKEQLVKELNALRRQVAQLQASGGQTIPAAAALGDSEAEYRLLVKNLPNVVFKGYQDWSVDFIDDKIGFDRLLQRRISIQKDKVAGHCGRGGPCRYTAKHGRSPESG